MHPTGHPLLPELTKPRETPDYFRAESFEDESTSKLKSAFTGAWLLEQVFPLLVYVVDGIIPEGLTLLVAAPKIGKSWLVLGIAIAISTGQKVLGCVATKAAPVLYLALEDGPRRLQSRLRTLGVTSLSNNLTFLTDVPRGDMVETIREFMDLHPGKNPVVILDTLGKAMPSAVAGETQYDRDYRVMGALKRLADDNPGSSVIIVHHTRKMDGADFLDAVSGTQGIAGAADTILLLKRSRHETQAQLQVTSRDAAEGEYILEQAGTGKWVLAGGSRAEAAKAATDAKTTDGVNDRMAEVIQLVNKYPEGMKAKDVATLLHLEDSTARVYLRRAFEAGRISNPSRGLYTAVTSVTSVTSEPELFEEVTQETHVTPLSGEVAA